MSFIEQGTETTLPLQAFGLLRFELVDTDGNQVTPTRVWSVQLFRTGRGQWMASDDSGITASLVFERRRTDNSGNALPIWTDTMQGQATATVASNRLAVFSVDRPHMGIMHDFSADTLLADSTPINADASRFTMTPSVDGDGLWSVSVDCANIAAPGTVLTLTYACESIPSGVKRVSGSIFESAFDGEEFHLLPGRHLATMDYETSSGMASSSIEFHVKQEPYALPPSARNASAQLDSMMLHRLPYDVIDSEGGPGGPTGQFFSYINQGLGQLDGMCDVLSSAWDPAICPTLFLRYIAWEQGSSVFTRDQALWRRQVVEMPGHLKSKGSETSLRNRLDACGATLEDLATFYQLQPRVFKADSWILNPNTPFEQDTTVPGVVTYRFPLSSQPWFFPDGEYDPRRMDGLFVLETRCEGEPSWRPVPSSNNGLPIARIERNAATGLYNLVITPWVATAGVVSSTATAILDGFNPKNFDQFRLTYPTASWGVTPFEKGFSPEVLAPQTHRSGHFGATVDVEGNAHYIVIEGWGTLTGNGVWLVNESDGSQTQLANLGEDVPQARRGAVCMQYTSGNFVLFGGTTSNGTILGDCWTLSVNAAAGTYEWTRFSGQCPAPRTGASTLDPTGPTEAYGEEDPPKTFSIFGGWGDAGVLGDTWDWKPDTNGDWLWEINNMSVASMASANPFCCGTSDTPAELTVDQSYEFTLDTVGVIPSVDDLVYICEADGAGASLAVVTQADGYTITATVQSVVTASETPDTARQPWVINKKASLDDAFTIDATPNMLGLSPGSVFFLRQNNEDGMLTIQCLVDSFDEVNSTLSCSTVSVVETSGSISNLGSSSLDAYEMLVTQRTPPARCGASSASLQTDTTSGVKLSFLFGGMLADGSFAQDLWVFSAGEGWMALRPAGVAPHARACAAVLPYSGGTGVLADTLVISGGMCGSPVTGDPIVTSGSMDTIFWLTGLTGSLSTCFDVAVADLEWDCPGVSVDTVGWPLVWIDTARACEADGCLFMPLHLDGRRSNRILSASQGDEGALSISQVVSAPDAGEVSFDEPVCLQRPIHLPDSTSAWSVEAAGNNHRISAPVSGMSVYDIAPSATAEQMPYTLPHRTGMPWSLIPRQRRVLVELDAVISQWPAIADGVNEITQRFYFLPDNDACFTPTGDERTAFGIEAGTSVKALVRVSGPVIAATGARNPVVTAVIDQYDQVTWRPAEPHTSVAWDTDGWFEVVTTRCPLHAEVIMADNQAALYPALGTYVAIADGWYTLVAPDGTEPQVEVVTAAGNSYQLEQGSFALTVHPESRRTDLWIVSDVEPVLEEGSFLRLTATVGRIAPKAPQPSVITTKEFVVPTGGIANGLVVAQGAGLLDQVIDEPAAFWSGISWNTDTENRITDTTSPVGTQTATSLALEHEWRVVMARPDGTVYDVPLSVIELTKTLDYASWQTSVRLNIASGDFPAPIAGSRIFLKYPTVSGVRILNPGQDIAAVSVWGAGDYVGMLGLASVGGLSTGDRPCWIDPAKIYSAGLPSVPAICVVKCQQAVVDFSQAPAQHRPLQDQVAYDGFRDQSWKLRMSGTTQKLWQSHLLTTCWWSNNSETFETDLDPESAGYPPLYASVVAVGVAIQSQTASSWNDRPSFSVTYPVPTVFSESGPIDLLRVVVCQEKCPEHANSMMGLSDWVELYIMHLPRADTRRIEDLGTYRLWKQQILDGKTPTVNPCPQIDHNTRLVDRRDSVIPTACSDLQPFPGDVTFGFVRTKAPYGLTVFGREEYDGSVKPSSEPCDIDLSFKEPCGCCPASAIGYSVNIPIHLGLSSDDVRHIVNDWLPANAVIRFANIRFASEDFFRNPVEQLEWIHEMWPEDVVMCDDPRRMPDGSHANAARVTQWLRSSFGTELSAVATVSAPAEWTGDTYVLDAMELRHCLAAIAPGRTSVWSNGVPVATVTRRLGEGTLLCTADVAPGLGDDVAAPYDLYHVPAAQATATSSTLARMQFQVSGVNLVESGVQVGDKLWLMSGPESADALEDAPTRIALDITAITPGKDGTWIEVNLAGFDTVPDVLSPSWLGPKAFAFSSAASTMYPSADDAWPRRSSLRVLKEEFGQENTAASAPRARLEMVAKQASDHFGTASWTAVFALPSSMLQGCYIIGDNDKANNAALSSLAVGSAIDGCGRIALSNGRKVADIYVKAGVVHVSQDTETTMPAISAVTYDGGLRTLNVTMTPVSGQTAPAGLLLVDFHYAGTGRDADAAWTRACACLMPRSMDADYDYDSSRVAVFGWSDGSTATGWLPQAAITWQTQKTVTVTCAGWSGLDIKAGDLLHLPAQDNILLPISKKLSGTQVQVVATQTLATIPTTNLGVEILRPIVSSNGQNANWSLVSEEVVVEASLPSGMTWDAAMASVSVLEMGESSWVIKAAETLGPGTGTVTLHTPVPNRLLPADATLITFVADDTMPAGRRMPAGGSYVELHVLDEHGNIVTTQQFN